MENKEKKIIKNTKESNSNYQKSKKYSLIQRHTQLQVPVSKRRLKT